MRKPHISRKTYLLVFIPGNFHVKIIIYIQIIDDLFNQGPQIVDEISHQAIQNDQMRHQDPMSTYINQLIDFAPNVLDNESIGNCSVRALWSKFILYIQIIGDLFSQETQVINETSQQSIQIDQIQRGDFSSLTFNHILIFWH